MKLHSFQNLTPAKLLRRYKRFLADFELPTGEKVTAHCPNPGRMSSILPSPEVCYLTDFREVANSTRKLDFRWELAQMKDSMVVVNTQLANLVAHELLLHLPQLRENLDISPQAILTKEVSLEPGDGVRTRFDFALTTPEGPTYIEVKQVSLRAADDNGLRWAAFPDAVTARGKRHLEELTRLKKEGFKTALLYMVGRSDVDAVRPAEEVDPAYAQAFREALAAGVLMQACRLIAKPEGLFFDDFLPVHGQLTSFTRPAG